MSKKHHVPKMKEHHHGKHQRPEVNYSGGPETEGSSDHYGGEHHIEVHHSETSEHMSNHKHNVHHYPRM